MGNQGEFICQNCQGKLFRMIPKINMTKEEIDLEVSEAKKGTDAHRFKIIDEKLYREEWESGMMIWTYTKKDLVWDLTKEATWFCRCGNYSQNYKDFIERNAKKDKGEKITLTEEQMNSYESKLDEANKKVEEKDKKIGELEEQIKMLKAQLLEKNEDSKKA